MGEGVLMDYVITITLHCMAFNHRGQLKNCLICAFNRQPIITKEANILGESI
jgi:hypothetical protein